MRRAFLLLLLAGSMVSVSAQACSCLQLAGAPAEQVEQSAAEADLVFLARLTRSSLGPDGDRKLVVERANFEVLEVFKGNLVLGQTIVISQVVSAGSCGRSSTNDPPWLLAQEKPGLEPQPVKISREWLIYANGAEPFELNRCSRSAPLNAGGKDDVKLLRAIIKRKRGHS